MNKLLKGGLVLVIVLLSVFSLLGLFFLFIASFCNQKDMLVGANLISDLFKGIGIGLAFLSVGYFVEKTKADYIQENEKLHTIINSDHSKQELLKNFSNSCCYNVIVLINFIDFMAERNPMFRNGLSDTARAGVEIFDLNPADYKKIDIHSLFFYSIKNIEFKKFSNKKMPDYSIEDLSRCKTAGVFKIELFTGKKFIYCPKLEKTEAFDTKEEFEKYYALFEKNDIEESYDIAWQQGCGME
jgi:hypothetical protein